MRNGDQRLQQIYYAQLKDKYQGPLETLSNMKQKDYVRVQIFIDGIQQKYHEHPTPFLLYQYEEPLARNISV